MRIYGWLYTHLVNIYQYVCIYVSEGSNKIFTVYWFLTLRMRVLSFQNEKD